MIISDVHANLEAFEKAMEVANGLYDQALCLGDLVGYGPDPNPVIHRVREVSSIIIRGNHDKACSGLMDIEDFNPLAQQATHWTHDQLSPEHLNFLRYLPAGPVMMDGFELVHGSPADEDEYIFGPTQALPVLKSMTLQTVIFGHTHFQGGFMLTPKGKFQSVRFPPTRKACAGRFALEPGGSYLINPGSVGQPRDSDWRAAFAVFDDKKNEIEYYRTPYDLAKTQQKMREAGLPEPLVKRLEFGR